MWVVSVQLNHILKSCSCQLVTLLPVYVYECLCVREEEREEIIQLQVDGIFNPRRACALRVTVSYQNGHPQN